MKIPHPDGWGIFSLFAAPEERRPIGRPGRPMGPNFIRTPTGVVLSLESDKFSVILSDAKDPRNQFSIRNFQTMYQFSMS